KSVAKERMQTMAHQTSTSFIDRIRQNPGAAAVTGIGLFMLFRGGAGSGTHVHQWREYEGDAGLYCGECGLSYGGNVEFETGGGARERIADLAGSARSRVSDVTD